MSTDSKLNNTNSDNPPIKSWSHIQETITLLYLSVCQIESSINESNHSVDKLTSSFTDLATHSKEINKQVQNISKASELDSFKVKVKLETDEMQVKINQAITAFQFYDRISQRLDHVARSLEETSNLLSLPSELNNQDSWHKIQNDVRESYSMDAERIMFEHIMRGSSVKEALEIYHHHFNSNDTKVNDDTEDEIELF